MTVPEEGRCIVGVELGQAAVARWLVIQDNPQLMRASVQPMMVTVVSSNRQVARSPLRSRAEW
jgi:hypothetical protein